VFDNGQVEFATSVVRVRKTLGNAAGISPGEWDVPVGGGLNVAVTFLAAAPSFKLFLQDLLKLPCPSPSGAMDNGAKVGTPTASNDACLADLVLKLTTLKGAKKSYAKLELDLGQDILMHDDYVTLHELKERCSNMLENHCRGVEGAVIEFRNLIRSGYEASLRSMADPECAIESVLDGFDSLGTAAPLDKIEQLATVAASHPDAMPCYKSWRWFWTSTGEMRDLVSNIFGQEFFSQTFEKDT